MTSGMVDDMDGKRRVTDYWIKFWFEPVSAYPLAVFRIGFGLVMMANLLGQYLPHYLSFYGDGAMVSVDAIYAHRWLNLPVFDLLFFLPSDSHSQLVFLYATIFLNLLFILGLGTQLSTPLLFLFLLSLHNHCPIILHAGDNYSRLVLLFLSFSGGSCGRVLSIDRMLSKNKEQSALIEPVAMRMIQLQFCFIYLINWLYKICGPIWLEGSAVYYATRLTQYWRFDYPAFLDNALSSRLLTWSTLVVEAALVFLLWIPRTRSMMIIIGISFHLFLDLTFNLGVFEWFFIVTFLLFVDGSFYEKVFRIKDR